MQLLDGMCQTIIYSESSHQDLSIDICTGTIRGGGGGPGGGPFFGVGLQKRILATSTDFQIYRRIPELKPSRFTPFLSKLDQGGDMWTCPKVRGTRSGAGRGVSQAKEAAITLFSCLLLKPIKDNFSLRN